MICVQMFGKVSLQMAVEGFGCQEVASSHVCQGLAPAAVLEASSGEDEQHPGTFFKGNGRNTVSEQRTH